MAVQSVVGIGVIVVLVWVVCGWVSSLASSSVVLRKVVALVLVPVLVLAGIPLDTDNIVEVGIVDTFVVAVVVVAPVDTYTGMAVDGRGSLLKETRLVVETWLPVSCFLLVCPAVLSRVYNGIKETKMVTGKILD